MGIERIPMEPVIVYQTFDLAEAQLIRSQLEGAGITAYVQHEQSATNFDVGSGGVRVVVNSDQAEEARLLIKPRSGNSNA